MTDGWCGDDHLILFEEAEGVAASERYAISQFLPGYQVIGLCSWDDFIFARSMGSTYSVPTVPAIAEYLSPYTLPTGGSTISPDNRLRGKIKWYVKPIVFGGDPKLGKNVIWVTHEQHAEIVRWWNNLYRSVKSQPAKPVGQ